MSRACPTTRIVSDNEQGYVVINTADFDPKLHKVYTEPPVVQPPKVAKPSSKPTKNAAS